jgi:hypothetical protein
MTIDVAVVQEQARRPDQVLEGVGGPERPGKRR